MKLAANAGFASRSGRFLGFCTSFCFSLCTKKLIRIRGLSVEADSRLNIPAHARGNVRLFSSSSFATAPTLPARATAG
jgi:hypothetical protein